MMMYSVDTLGFISRISRSLSTSPFDTDEEDGDENEEDQDNDEEDGDGEE